MAEELPNQNADAGGADGSAADARGCGPEMIDMTGCEAALNGVRGPEDEQTVGPGVPAQRRPTVEWAIVWSDGRHTRVSSEAAARIVVTHCPGCEVVCRIVGDWGPP